MTGTEVGLIWFAIGGGILAFLGMGFGGTIVFLGLLLFIAAFSLRQIPASPPSVAALVRLGKRVQDLVLHERYVLALPYFEELVIETILPETKEMEFANIRHVLESQADGAADPTKKQSGGSSRAKVMLVYVPDSEDGTRFNNFLNAGGRDGINKMTNGIIAGPLRKAGAKKTFEEFAFSKAELTMELIEMMTGEKPIDISEEGVKAFLNNMLQKGVSDIQDLGIIIRRLEVIAIDPEGELEKDAELAAREVQQRRGEERDTDTELALAKKYVTESIVEGKPTITLKEALEYVRLRRNKNSSETFVRSSGNPILDAAVALGGQTKQ